MEEDYRNESAIAAMHCSNELASACRTIGEVIAALAEKRVTLEEKMMRAYLHEVVVESGRCMGILHTLTMDGVTLDEHVLTTVQNLGTELSTALNELQKAIQHNLNYLEQYFEFDFNARLHNEYKFPQRLREVCTQLSDCARIKPD